jgi:hypothetical protein
MAADVGHVDAAAVVGSDRVRRKRRGVLGYVPGTGLQFRTRTAVSSTDTVTTQAGITNIFDNSVARTITVGSGATLPESS